MTPDTPSSGGFRAREGGVRKPSGRGSVTRQVTESLFQMLRSGSYRVGDRLPSEWELVERLSVGRSAVREGTRELVALGLVELRAGRGTFVRSLRPDLLIRPASFGDELDAAVTRELLEVRRIVEPGAAALAAQRATVEDVDRLRHDVERLREAVHAGYRPPEDLGFHLDVIRAAHNTALARVGGAIVNFYERDIFLPSERDVREHAEICQAISARDAALAEDLMRTHLDEEEELRRPS